MRRLSLLFVLLIMTVKIWAAQDSITYAYPHLNGRFMKSCLTDGRDLVEAPFHWKGKQWATFGAIAASGIILYSQDEKIRNFWQDNKSPAMTNIFTYGLEPWGSGKYSVPLVGGLFLIGLLDKNDRLSATALTAGKAALLSGLMIEITKYATQRQRPYQGNPANHTIWRGPFSHSGYKSFPSGHTGLVFSIATVIASEYRHKVWVPVLCYTIATGTGLQRMYDDKHWATSVFIGAVTGYAFGKFLWRHNRISSSKITINPSVGMKGYGLNVSLKIG